MLVLKDDEEALVLEVEAYLNSKNPEDAVLVRQRFNSLRALGEAISRFPPVREAQTLRGELRDESQLIESLCSFSPPSRLLHIPTRVVASRSFLVAKCHAFTLLSLLSREREDFFASVRRVGFSIVCTLMAEEVYFSCLEDPSFSEKIKFQLATDLISLWESGIDPRQGQHLPALEALWKARDEAPPSFGTMDGSSELMRISIDLGEDWRGFIVDQIGEEEIRWALEEFLFGLSYEEIEEVRARLTRFGISAVDRNDIRSYLGSHPAYTIVKDTEPRAVYDFYVDRRDAAAFRKQSFAPGPLQTLEEMYLKHRILQS